MSAAEEIRWLGREQSRRVDALAMRLGTSELTLMERAGTACAERIFAAYSPRVVWIACGVGNNGGDGLVIARHLLQRGVVVRLWLVGDLSKMTAATAANWERWLEMGQRQEAWPPNRQEVGPDVAVDCLLGTGSKGDPRPPVAEAIEWLNRVTSPRVAIDLPSGLDCDSGEPGKPTVHADWTLTMVGPKRGFRAAQAAPYVGRWEVIDLELPAGLIAQACEESSGEW